jgi:predicted Na+-dependent transporter
MHTLDKLIGVVLVTTFMLQIGLGLTPRVLRDEVRHVGKLLHGLALFLVVAPVLAALLAVAFHVDRTSGVAMVLLSCVGVAPLAAKSARASRGDVALAVVLTFALGLLTVVTAAPTARWLLGYSPEVPIRPAALIPKLALLQVAPLLLGLWLRDSGRRAKSIERVVGWINTAAFVAAIVLIVAPHLGDITAAGWRGAGATITFSLLLALTGYIVGGPGTSEGRTLAGMANVPNVGLALGIATSISAPRVLLVTIVGVFLLRAIVGVVVHKMVGRRAQPEHPADTVVVTETGMGDAPDGVHGHGTRMLRGPRDSRS